jgi:excisionase family DNA binding protein
VSAYIPRRPRILWISRTTLWELISDGEVRAVKAGKAVRIDRRSLEE